MKTIFSKVKELEETISESILRRERLDNNLLVADGRVDKLQKQTDDSISSLWDTISSLEKKVEKLNNYVSSEQASKFQDQSKDKNLRLKCLEITEKKYGQPNVKEAEKLFDYISKGKVTE